MGTWTSLNLDSPCIYSDPTFCVEFPTELKLEERDELILLDSPATPSPSSPAPTPAKVCQTFASTLSYPIAVQEPLCPARHWSAPPLSPQGQSLGLDVLNSQSSRRAEHFCIHPSPFGFLSPPLNFIDISSSSFSSSLS